MEKKEFEKIRREAAEQSKKRTRILVCGSIIILVLAILVSAIASANRPRFGRFTTVLPFMFTFMFAVFFILLFFVLVTLFHPARKALLKYQVAYKKYFVQRSLAKIFTNLAYQPEAGLPRAIVQTVMTGGDRYHSNDYVTGIYKKIRFTGADVHTEREHRHTDSDGHTTTTYSTIFKGRFLIFDFNRDFSFRLQLAGKSFVGDRLPKFVGEKKKFERMTTESIEFNKHFNIYAQDGLEMFYILDPSFIEKLQSICETYRNRILFSFIDKKLIVAINDNGDSFEPPRPDKLIDEETEIKRVNGDIDEIIQIVDKLMLNRYAFERKA